MTDLSRHLQNVGLAGAPSPAQVGRARRALTAFRADHGRGPAQLFTAAGHNGKLAKGDKSLRSCGLELHPGTITPDRVAQLLPMAPPVERVNVCRWSTTSCDPGRGGGCLGNHAGRNVPGMAHAGKLLRTLFALQDPEAFLHLVAHELDLAIGRGEHIRLNVLSDLEWHRIAPHFFDGPRAGATYDYTKDHRRIVDGWHLTYSISERHGLAEVAHLVERGQNAAMVVDVPRGAPMPTAWRGLPMIDGDAHDNRWTDPRGVIVGLRAKDASGRGLSTQPVGIRHFVKPAS